MNRAKHLRDLLADGKEHCTFDLWPEEHTAPMRAKYELRKMGVSVETVGFHRHNEANYAVYQIKRSAIIEELARLKITQEPTRQEKLI